MTVRACAALLAALLLAPAAAGEDACRPIEGVGAVLGPGKVLLLGELHGTVESPAFVADVVCHALAAGLDVVVGVELLPSIRPGVDALFASGGAAAGRQKLLAGPSWQRSYQDGRNSRAMADLLVSLARMRKEGRSVEVALFDARPSGGGQARERAMADHLAASVASSPDALHVVLTGNLHSRITQGNRRSPDYEPMGYLLAGKIGGEKITALDVSYADGSAWICAPDCGIARLRGRGGAEAWKIEIDEASRPSGHHGLYAVGPITASPPAVGDHADAMPPEPQPAGQSPTPEPLDEFPAQKPEMFEPFQGFWQAWQYGSRAWTIDIDGRSFRGVLGPDDWYGGTLRLHPDEDPAQIDFVIEDCRCQYRGMASRGIFVVNGESIFVSAPRPGDPRPVMFDQNDGKLVELKRAER